MTGVVMDVHERMLLERQDQDQDARHSQLRMSMEEREEEREERRIFWRQILLTIFSWVAIYFFDIPLYLLVLMILMMVYLGYLEYFHTFVGLTLFLYARIFYKI